MTGDHRAYCLKRAEAELALAACAAHPEAMRAHYHLAGLYLDRAYGSHSGEVDPPDMPSSGAPERDFVRSGATIALVCRNANSAG